MSQEKKYTWRGQDIELLSREALIYALKNATDDLVNLREMNRSANETWSALLRIRNTRPDRDRNRITGVTA